MIPYGFTKIFTYSTDCVLKNNFSNIYFWASNAELDGTRNEVEKYIKDCETYRAIDSDVIDNLVYQFLTKTLK